MASDFRGSLKTQEFSPTRITKEQSALKTQTVTTLSEREKRLEHVLYGGTERFGQGRAQTINDKSEKSVFCGGAERVGCGPWMSMNPRIRTADAYGPTRIRSQDTESSRRIETQTTQDLLNLLLALLWD